MNCCVFQTEENNNAGGSPSVPGMVGEASESIPNTNVINGIYQKDPSILVLSTANLSVGRMTRIRLLNAAYKNV